MGRWEWGRAGPQPPRTAARPGDGEGEEGGLLFVQTLPPSSGLTPDPCFLFLALFNALSALPSIDPIWLCLSQTQVWSVPLTESEPIPCSWRKPVKGGGVLLSNEQNRNTNCQIRARQETPPCPVNMLTRGEF